MLKIVLAVLCWIAANSIYNTQANGSKASIRAFMGSPGTRGLSVMPKWMAVRVLSFDVHFSKKEKSVETVKTGLKLCIFSVTLKRTYY